MSSNRKFRRTARTLASLCLVGCALAGCGFTPLYGSSGTVQQQMGEVAIGNIPDRPGQLLRQDLQDQFQLAGAPTQQIYVLSVSFAVNQFQIGVQPDTSTTRDRFTAIATWTLAPIGNPETPLTQGQANTEDALNIIDQQYFAQELETNTVNAQVASQIAAQIASQVAAYFKTHPNAG